MYKLIYLYYKDDEDKYRFIDIDAIFSRSNNKNFKDISTLLIWVDFTQTSITEFRSLTNIFL